MICTRTCACVRNGQSLSAPQINWVTQFIGLVFLRMQTCSQHVRLDRSSLDVEANLHPV
jgi:hypothetical protein